MFPNTSDPCELVTYGATMIVALVYVVFQCQQKQWMGLGTFVLVLAALAGCCMSGLCPCVSDLRVCVLLAILAANIVALPQRPTNDSETFANPDADADADTDTDVTDAANTAAVVAAASADAAAAAAAKAPTASAATPTGPVGGGTSDTETTAPQTNHVDNFSTFMETYKSLTPGQIETMTSDTKDLIKTQQSLMETVKSLAPVISQGREMMDTFKDYFGPNAQQDMMKAVLDKSSGASPGA
jgi:hypothetical protein